MSEKNQHNILPNLEYPEILEIPIKCLLQLHPPCQSGFYGIRVWLESIQDVVIYCHEWVENISSNQSATKTSYHKIQLTGFTVMGNDTPACSRNVGQYPGANIWGLVPNGIRHRTPDISSIL